MSDIKIELNEGEYVYNFSEKTGVQTVTRNGEVWTDETGNNFLLAMATEVDRLRLDVEVLESELENWVTD